MAERRMFAKSIISSGRFLKLNPAARLLYYDLGMFADDDGVVEAYTVLAITRASEEDLNTLIDKGFIKLLNDEQVCYICDWSTNNLIRGDRYRASVYKDLLNANGLPSGNQVATSGKPTVNQRLTQVSIVKDRLGKDIAQPKKNKFNSFQQNNTNYAEVVERKAAERAKQ